MMSICHKILKILVICPTRITLISIYIYMEEINKTMQFCKRTHSNLNVNIAKLNKFFSKISQYISDDKIKSNNMPTTTKLVTNSLF